MPLRALLMILLALLPTSALAQTDPCGAEAPCEIGDGSYHLLLPEGWDDGTPRPVLVWFHGHRSSGASIFRSSGLQRDFVEAGYVLIAPNGALRPSGIRGWPARPTGPELRDDVAFTLAVLADVGARMALDPERTYVSGFSAGGSMAWMMACYAGERFTAAASVAGALRRPHPDGAVCPAGPVRFLQIHGFTDAQVPFEGRAIGDWHQGDVFSSLSRIRATNACRSNPDAITLDTPLRCRDWSESCASGAAVRLCIHDGGHGLPPGWTLLARDWFEATPATQ
ncbi:MAG: PHB depolymerase family esterase [Pseudomonadota bacterium]